MLVSFKTKEVNLFEVYYYRLFGRINGSLYTVLRVYNLRAT